MPSYDYRCNNCGRSFVLFYKSFKDYDPAANPPSPPSQSVDVARRIRRVAIQKPGRDMSQLSSNEMLNVFNTGDSKEIGKMFKQVSDTAGGDLGSTYNEATSRLLKGESMDSVERDLSSRESAASSDTD